MKFETRLTDDLIARYQKSGHWGAETFYSILAARAAAHPDRLAIVDRGRRVTYGELRTRVDGVAAGKMPDLLSGQLARDALVMCLKECESVRAGRVVAMG